MIDQSCSKVTHSAVLIGIVASLFIQLAGFAQTEPSVAIRALVDHAVKSPGNQAFTFDRSVYDRETRELPIGVFDSGIGGLTVLEAILGLDQFNNASLQPAPDGIADFAGEKFIYFGDAANMPYGNYAAVGKEDYLRELILKDAIFLLGNRIWPQPDAEAPIFSKPPVKAVVIACNTATAYGLDDLKAAMKRWNIPVFVVGVVEAGARGVLELHSKSGNDQGPIAVLATVGTCSSGAYPRLIQSALGRAGKPVPVIVQQGFVELAAAIEGDSTIAKQGSIRDYLERDLRRLVDDYRTTGAKQPINTIVLGCTHYPLVQSEILDTLSSLRNSKIDEGRPYAELIAETVQFVNPAELTAKELFRELSRNRLRTNAASNAISAIKVGSQTKSAGNDPNAIGNSIAVSFFVSVANKKSRSIPLTGEGALEQQYKYSRPAGNLQVEDTINVPMVAQLLPAPSIQLMKNRLPLVWNCFQANQK